MSCFPFLNEVDFRRKDDRMNEANLKGFRKEGKKW
jgi:hypothetical protein